MGGREGGKGDKFGFINLKENLKIQQREDQGKHATLGSCLLESTSNVLEG